MARALSSCVASRTSETQGLCQVCHSCQKQLTQTLTVCLLKTHFLHRSLTATSQQKRIVSVTRPDHRQLFLQERQDAVHWGQGAAKEKSYQQGRCGKEKGDGGGGDHFQPNQEPSQQRGRGKASPQRRSSNKASSYSSLG